SGNACRALNSDLRCSTADPHGNHTRGCGEIQADHAESPFDLQPGEIEPAQLGGNLPCAALDHDLPRDGAAECDLSRTLLPARNPQTPWIADSDNSLFGLHIWHGSLEAGLVERALDITRTQGQPEGSGGED